MTAEEFIKEHYGESWLINQWTPGDVIDIMGDYRIRIINELIEIIHEESHEKPINYANVMALLKSKLKPDNGE